MANAAATSRCKLHTNAHPAAGHWPGFHRSIWILKRVCALPSFSRLNVSQGHFPVIRLRGVIGKVAINRKETAFLRNLTAFCSTPHYQSSPCNYVVSLSVCARSTFAWINNLIMSCFRAFSSILGTRLVHIHSRADYGRVSCIISMAIKKWASSLITSAIHIRQQWTVLYTCYAECKSSPGAQCFSLQPCWVISFPKIKAQPNFLLHEAFLILLFIRTDTFRAKLRLTAIPAQVKTAEMQ